MRGTVFYYDYSTRNLVFSNNVIKIDAEDTICRKGSCVDTQGAPYNDVYLNNKQSLSNYKISWTLDIETAPDANILIKDKNGKVKVEAVANANRKNSTPLVQCMIHPTEWTKDGNETEVENTSGYQEEDFSPYTVIIEADGITKSTTVEMIEKTALKVLFKEKR